MENKTIAKSHFWTIAGLVLLVLISWLPIIDDIADKDVDAGFNRALVSFGIAKGLNMVISLLQSAQISTQPLGIAGFAISPGELLDPLNDLIEQFSNFMLLATVAFGIQKILIAIGGHVLVKTVLSALGVTAAWFMFKDRPMPLWLKNALIMIILVRLAVPAATVMSNMAYEVFLAPKYQESTTALKDSSLQLESIKTANQENVTTNTQETVVTTDQEPVAAITLEPVQQEAAPQEVAPPAKKSWLSAAKTILTKTKSLLSSFMPPSPAELMQRVNEKFNVWSQQVNQIGEDVTRNVVNQIVVFLLQTLIFPIGLIWALYKIGISLMYRSRPK